MLVKGLLCLMSNCLLATGAQASAPNDGHLNEAHVVAMDSATAASVPVAKTFDITTPDSYTITLTDVGRANAGVGNPFTSLSLVITQGDQLIKLLTVAESTGSSGIATATITLNSGTYSAQVLGATGGASAYIIDIAGAGGSILSNNGSVNTTNPSILSTQVDLNLVSGQSYSVSLQDYALPAALNSAHLTILSGPSGNQSLLCDLSLSNNVAPCSFTAGAQNKLVILADSTSQGAGLVGAKITTGATTVFAQTYPVGNLAGPGAIDIPATGTYALTFTDLAIPAALMSLQAVLVQGADVLTTASNNTSTNFSASQGTAQLYVKAVPDSTKNAGIYAVQLMQGTATVYSNAVAVTGTNSGTVDGFSYSFTAGKTGSYKLSLTDLAAPNALSQVYAVLTHDTTQLANIYGGTTTASLMADLTAGNEYVLSIVAGTGAGKPFGMYGVSLFPPPTVTFTASKTSDINSGDSVTLQWSSSDATSCAASNAAGNGWSGAKSTSGAQTFGPVNANTDLTLTCTGPAGDMAKTLNLTVASTTSAGGGGGGGALSLSLLLGLGGLCGARRIVRCHQS